MVGQSPEGRWYSDLNEARLHWRGVDGWGLEGARSLGLGLPATSSRNTVTSPLNTECSTLSSG